jgi:hypothetical protein
MSVIAYKLSFDKGNAVEFAVDTERQSPTEGIGLKPFWTRLGHHQCPNCPLAARPGRYCPAALDIEHIVDSFAHIESYAQVDVQVQIGERTHSKRTDVQSALRSLLGLSLATSACPVLSQMKGPGRLHMPFATVEETLFRMVGAYFVGQYIKAQQGEMPDFSLESLSRMYAEVQTVNQHLKKRLDDAVLRDANVNAVVSLMSVAMLVSFSLDHQLQELEPFAIQTGFGAPGTQ